MLGLVVSVVVTRSLGPEQRGVYFLLATTTAVGATLAELGVAAACTTFLARGRHGLREIHRAAVVLSIAFGIAAFGVASALYPLVHDTAWKNVPYRYLAVALALVSVSLYHAYWNAIMVGLNRIPDANRLNLAFNVANGTAVVVAVGALDGGIPGFLAAWAATSGAVALVELGYASRLARAAPRRAGALREILRFGLRAQGASASHHLLLRFDVFAVNALSGTRSVGIYSLAASLAEKTWIPSTAIGAASASAIAGRPRAASSELAARVARTALLLISSLAVVVGVAGVWLVPFVYGSAFSAAVTPLAILLVGAPLFAGMLVLSGYVVGQLERPGLASLLSWATFAVSVPLYLVLTKWHGIVGAAIASTLVYGLAFAAYLAVFSRSSGLGLAETLVPRRSDLKLVRQPGVGVAGELLDRRG